MYSSHIMSFAWSILYDMSLSLFFFLVYVIYPWWTHLFKRAKIMLWFVRIALYASLQFFDLWNCSSASLISIWAQCALILLKKCSHASLRFIWELVKFLKKFYHASLILFWEKKFLCSCSSLKFVWAYQKQHMKLVPKW